MAIVFIYNWRLFIKYPNFVIILNLTDDQNRASRTTIIIFGGVAGICAACVLFGIILGVFLSKKKTGPESSKQIPLQPVSEGKFSVHEIR